MTFSRGMSQGFLKEERYRVDGRDFYFVHSYHAVLDDVENLSATADYGFDVTAAVSRDNVFATQFHPEKSGEHGLRILRNFVNLE